VSVSVNGTPPDGKLCVRIKVISLPSSTSMRDSIRRQFDGLGIGFEFFDAVAPDNATAHITCYDASEFIVNCGRTATSTEIACYASHLALWRQCAEDNEPSLILQDDAQLDDAFRAGLFVASCQINKLGFIRVSPPVLRSSPVIDQLGPFRIHFCRRVPLTAVAYALSPDAAEQLADRGSIVEEPVDRYLQRFWRHRHPVFAISPPIVRPSTHARGSEIGETQKLPTSAGVWLRRACRTAQNEIARTHYNALHL